MIKKIVVVVLLLSINIYAGLVEDGVIEAKKGKNIEALKLFELSCLQEKIAQGCFYSGQAYAKGTIVTKDINKAFDFFSKSCDLGYTSGCMIVGSSYYYGRDVKKDYNKAQEMFQTACKQGDANGCFLLGSMYDLGQGIKRDVKKAKQFYINACGYGSEMACKYKQQMQ